MAKAKAGEHARAMESTKRKALVAAGWKIGDAADFLGMSAEARQLLDARVKLALAIRQQRQARGLSQKELGSRLKTTQPRVAKIERAASDVSMDQLVRAFTAAGGKLIMRTSKRKATKGKGPAKKNDAVVLEVLGVDPSKTAAAFDKIMSKTRPGRGPSMRDVDAAIGSR